MPEKDKIFSGIVICFINLKTKSCFPDVINNPCPYFFRTKFFTTFHLNIANPLAQILSVAMLFEYFDCKAEGALIRKAVDASLDANVRTPEYSHLSKKTEATPYSH